jgi:pimeloyl-ACP methyl ester carboxylesterase
MDPSVPRASIARVQQLPYHLKLEFVMCACFRSIGCIVAVAGVLAMGTHAQADPQPPAAPRPQFARPAAVRSFKVDIPQARIDAILARVRAAKLPRQIPSGPGATSAWETGMDLAWLEGLRRYWVERFDWRAAEARLNRYPQYIAKVDGYDIHFYYVQGEGKNPLPLVLTHGWPGSVVEFLDMIGPLTEPSRHGGKASDAFTVIIPSLPGYGFSSMPDHPIMAISTAKLWHKLVTEVIGHPSYVAQGGDIGSAVTVQLAYLFPQSVKGIHLNLTPWLAIPAEQQTPAETKWIADYEAYMAREFDYLRMQMNKPMMPAVALVDSPLGTAAWIAEKFWAWADHKGNLDAVIRKDTLLTDIMLYLVNDSGIDGSFWFYRAIRDEMTKGFHPGFIKTPTAIARFPKEYPMGSPELSTAKRGYNVTHFTDMPRGGHFAALEQPGLLVDDLRSAFRPLR